MPDQITDNILISNYLHGDQKSLEILIARYIDPIYNFLARYVGDLAEANDLTQETFVKVWKNLKKFDQTKSFKTWIYTIARNTALDRIRKKKALPFSELEEEQGEFLNQFESEEKLADTLFDEKIERRKLQEAIESLPSIYQTVLLLRYQENLNFQEIAEVLGDSIDTIKSRYRRGLIRLKEALAPK